MLLVMDIGNTHTVIGVYQEQALRNVWRFKTMQGATPDELAIYLNTLFKFQGIGFKQIEDMVVSCVVPPMVNAVLSLGQKYFSCTPLLVGPGTKTGMPIHYDNPHEIGADRIVNAVAGYEKYKSALIIVDFGTATTFDYVSEKGEYEGGIIAPGILISAEALFIHASRLPRVEIFSKPKYVISKDTVSAMNAGLIYGFASMVDGLIERIKQEVLQSPLVLATGGLAPLIVPETGHIDRIEEHLILEGLKIIYYRNV